MVKGLEKSPQVRERSPIYEEVSRRKAKEMRPEDHGYC